MLLCVPACVHLTLEYAHAGPRARQEAAWGLLPVRARAGPILNARRVAVHARQWLGPGAANADQIRSKGIAGNNRLQ